MNDIVQEALNKGFELHKAGQLDLAKQLYASVIQVEPLHADANHNLGVIEIDTGKVSEAKPLLRIALEANPDNAQYWVSYIDLLMRLGEFGDAQHLLTQAKDRGAKGEEFDQLEQRLDELSQTSVENDGNNGVSDTVVKTFDNQDPPQDQLQPLIELYSQGQLQQALVEAKQLLQQFPNSVTLHNICGAANAGLGQLGAAMDSFKHSLKLKPDHADAYYNIGNTQKSMGELDAAIESYKQALKLKPDYAHAYNNMGNALKEQGSLEGSIEAYNKALSLNPDYADAYNNMGNSLKDQGKLEKAIGAFNKALTIKPDYADAYNNMGNALKEQGKLEDAIEAYNMALSRKPDYAEASYNMALLLHETAQYKKAATLFKKDGSSKSQTYLLKCLYELDEQANFYDQLDYLVNRGENNAVIGSYISRSQIRYGINKANPFCNEPLKYALKTDLKKKCDFKNIFVKAASDILNHGSVQNRKQGLITNGIQTAGNVFTQIGDVTDRIQNILRSEIENYRIHFKDSKEGMIMRWPSAYEINGWLVSMKSGGSISPHMHETGWISGSVYINVPPKLNEDSGNLVVCLGSGREKISEEKNSRSIDAVTGSLCLFPSSLLHYTVPFEANEDRIVLAFDIIPK